MGGTGQSGQMESDLSVKLFPVLTEPVPKL